MLEQTRFKAKDYLSEEMSFFEILKILPQRAETKLYVSYLLSAHFELLIIKSLNETAHGYCEQVELQLRPKLASSTHKSLKILVKERECIIPDFPLIIFLSSALNFRTKMH